MGESPGSMDSRPRSSSPDSVHSLDLGYCPQPGETTSASSSTGGGARNYATAGGFSATTGGFSGSTGSGAGGLNFAKIIKKAPAAATRPVNPAPARGSGMVLLG